MDPKEILKTVFEKLKEERKAEEEIFETRGWDEYGAREYHILYLPYDAGIVGFGSTEKAAALRLWSFRRSKGRFYVETPGALRMLTVAAGERMPDEGNLDGGNIDQNPRLHFTRMREGLALDIPELPTMLKIIELVGEMTVEASAEIPITRP